MGRRASLSLVVLLGNCIAVDGRISLLRILSYYMNIVDQIELFMCTKK